MLVVDERYVRRPNDPLELLHDGGAQADLPADDRVVLVVAVVGVSELAAGANLKFLRKVRTQQTGSTERSESLPSRTPHVERKQPNNRPTDQPTNSHTHSHTPHVGFLTMNS